MTKASVRWEGGPAREVGYEYGAVDPQAIDRLIDANGDEYARFGYDPAGNMTERVTPEGTWNFTWDGEGQIREAVGPRGREVYHYDHRGQRVLAVTDEGVRFWFDERETHFDAQGNQTRRYLHLSGTGPTLARVEDGDKIELQYADGLQNLMLSLDRNADRVASFLYGPFGEVVHATGAEHHRRRFNGKESDAVTGLRYYGFRYYDPLTLRWNSADPLYRLTPEVGLTDPQRLNLYAFSLNNPIRYYDPDGREADDGRNAAIAAGCVVRGEGETFSCIPVDKGEEIDVERDRDPASILADLKVEALLLEAKRVRAQAIRNLLVAKKEGMPEQKAQQELEPLEQKAREGAAKALISVGHAGLKAGARCAVSGGAGCAAAISLAAIDAGVAVSKQRQLEGKAEAKRQEVRSHQRKAVDALWAARGFQARGALLGLEAALTMYATDKVLGN